jgi:hypothetical protein
MSKPEDASPSPAPLVTTVVVAGADHQATRRLVESLRAAATGPHQVVVVVDPAVPGADDLARELGDLVVTVPAATNRAQALNAGLGAAADGYVAFCAAATGFPRGWDRLLVETAVGHPGVAVVAAGAAGPGEARTGAPDDPASDRPVVLAPFSPAPPPVLYLLATELARALGPWDEGYLDDRGAEADLCFTVWANDLDVAVDPRVTLEPLGGSGSPVPAAGPAPPCRRFRDRWEGEGEVVRLASSPPDRFARNRATARSVARWMARDEAGRIDDAVRMRRQLRAMGSVNRQLLAQLERPGNRLERTARGVVGPSARKAVNRLSPATVRRVRRALGQLSPTTEVRLRRLARRLGITRGPDRA